MSLVISLYPYIVCLCANLLFSILRIVFTLFPLLSFTMTSHEVLVFHI